MAEQEKTTDIEKAITVFEDFIAYCEETRREHDLTSDKLALQALREKLEREEIQSECDYCNTNPCWGCEYAGECKAWKHCKNSNGSDYKPRYNFCHICGRRLVEVQR